MLTMNKTGDMRAIANSAWISTMSESRAKSRTDEDVNRVVCFLAKHMHTSPFESVTLSFVEKEVDSINKDLLDLSKNKYSKSSCFKDGLSVTIDLLNFAKHSYNNSFENDLWKKFELSEPKISEVVKLFNFSKEEDSPEDVSDLFTHEVEVELISLHKGLSRKESRATWRVKCPLSVAVQILRHRTASFNMVSGRYKTIRQEVVGIPGDIIKILDSVDYKDSKNELGDLVDDILSKMDESKSLYLKTMKELKRCKDNESITNEEYKRMREYVRFVLPEGRLTELYITMYLDDLENFLMLRNSAHAQVEHIAVAQLMKKTIENI